jgi:hypothetical protein
MIMSNNGYFCHCRNNAACLCGPAMPRPAQRGAVIVPAIRDCADPVRLAGVIDD